MTTQQPEPQPKNAQPPQNADLVDLFADDELSNHEFRGDEPAPDHGQFE